MSSHFGALAETASQLQRMKEHVVVAALVPPNE